MDKKEYVLNQFRRTWNKKYENYCIERIYHKLDNPDLKFVTQQMFRRNENKIALADLYFPQLKLSVEIDEEYHKSQTEKDQERTEDILAKMRCLESVVEFEPEELRINAGSDQTLESINKQIDAVVAEINKRIKQLYRPLEWDTIIKTAEQIKSENRGIHDGEVALHTIWEVSELFNKGYGQGLRTCFFEATKGSNIWIWCPKLKLEGIKTMVPFTNEISLDGNTIYESAEINNEDFVNEVLTPSGLQQERFVFPYYKIESGEMAYVFKGIYQLDADATKRVHKRVWRRTGRIIVLSTPDKRYRGSGFDYEPGFTVLSEGKKF